MSEWGFPLKSDSAVARACLLLIHSSSGEHVSCIWLLTVAGLVGINVCACGSGRPGSPVSEVRTLRWSCGSHGRFVVPGGPTAPCSCTSAFPPMCHQGLVSPHLHHYLFSDLGSSREVLYHIQPDGVRFTHVFIFCFLYWGGGR